MKRNVPRGERKRLCLQLILHAHLHQFEMPLTEAAISELCTELGMQNVPGTREGRIAALQVLAAQLLPQMS
ncbi:hypothetical protein ACUDCK_16660 [Achromobacter sp. CF-sbj1-Ac2-l]|uniref:Uncharacterized protein n=1 Tax=Achromobacter dolens TaxID=1287738 RepID=A0A6S7C3G2_9BURK|nr:hypothetical protein [Achromobacter dolens]CAB3829796.1 hypothetical protein LMG26841_00902 [Achromobacter dolens]